MLGSTPHGPGRYSKAAAARAECMDQLMSDGGHCYRDLDGRCALGLELCFGATWAAQGQKCRVHSV